MIDEIMVSIECITYNHEKYIAKALDSFLMQKTNFKYEIIVHDDASTDKTAEIIREYESKDPDKFICIYQQQNQYSLGKSNHISEIIKPYIRGKYKASCEGDDYWIDSMKLQKQVDYMEKHPECSLCVHAARIVSSDGEELEAVVRLHIGDKNYTTDEVISSGERLFPTASMFQRAEYLDTMPDFYKNVPVGDLPSQIYYALCGDSYYMDEYMSVYRQNAKGSWTNKAFLSLDRQIDLGIHLKQMYEQADEYSGFRHHGAFEKAINKYSLLIALNTGDYKTVREIRETVDQSYLRRTTKMGLRFPRLYRMYVYVRLYIRKIKLRNK